MKTEIMLTEKDTQQIKSLFRKLRARINEVCVFIERKEPCAIFSFDELVKYISEVGLYRSTSDDVFKILVSKYNELNNINDFELCQQQQQ